MTPSEPKRTQTLPTQATLAWFEESVCSILTAGSHQSHAIKLVYSLPSPISRWTAAPNLFGLKRITRISSGQLRKQKKYCFNCISVPTCRHAHAQHNLRRPHPDKTRPLRDSPDLAEGLIIAGNRIFQQVNCKAS